MTFVVRKIIHPEGEKGNKICIHKYVNGIFKAPVISLKESEDLEDCKY